MAAPSIQPHYTDLSRSLEIPEGCELSRATSPCSHNRQPPSHSTQVARGAGTSIPLDEVHLYQLMRRSLCDGCDERHQQPVDRVSAETRRATLAPHGGPLRRGPHPSERFSPWVGIHGSGMAVGCCPALACAGGAACVPHYVFVGHGGPIQTTRRCPEAFVQGDA